MTLHRSYLAQQEASKESHSANIITTHKEAIKFDWPCLFTTLYCTRGTCTSSPNFIGVSNTATVHMQQKMFEGFCGSLRENQMYEISTHVHAHNAMTVCIREISL